MKEKIKVLLAEDNLINQKLTLISLKRINFDIQVASDGLEALNYYKSDNFDLILMDIRMPLMDGYQVTEAIRLLEKNSNSHIPIIAFTANTLDHDLEKCIHSGMDDYMVKPLDINKLKYIIQRLGILF